MRSLRFGLLVAAVSWLASSASAQLTTVDLVALYTDGTADRYGGDSGALTRIHHVVAVSNQIYADSDASIRLRLVHAERVDYSDSVSSGAALDDLTFEGRPLHQVAAALREQHGGDLVTLLRPYVGDGSCGIAWLGGPGSGGVLRSWDASYAYSHVSIDCGDYVLAHELGHNMGLGHSRRQDPEGGTLPFSVGYGVDGLFATTMAYESSFGAPKVYKFSNPALQCFGAPCGVSRSDPSNGADAAYSLDVVRTQLADYRDEVVPSEPEDPVEPDDPEDPDDPVEPDDPGGPSDPDDPTDPDDPDDPTDPTDPVVEPPVPGEIRVLFPKRGKRRLRAGRSYEIRWEASGVASVTVAYRTSEKQGRSRVESPEWTEFATGVAGQTLQWTAPELAGKKPKLQLRLTGLDALGREVAVQATRRLRVKAPRR